MAAKKKAPKAPKAPKAKRPAGDTKNGITRPAAGTVTGTIWDIADKLAAKGPVVRADVMDAAVAKDIAEATVATQFQRWRIYNGITERSTRAKADKQPKKKAPKAPKGSKKAPKAPPAPAAAAS